MKTFFSLCVLISSLMACSSEPGKSTTKSVTSENSIQTWKIGIVAPEGTCAETAKAIGDRFQQAAQVPLVAATCAQDLQKGFKVEISYLAPAKIKPTAAGFESTDADPTSDDITFAPLTGDYASLDVCLADIPAHESEFAKQTGLMVVAAACRQTIGLEFGLEVYGFGTPAKNFYNVPYKFSGYTTDVLASWFKNYYRSKGIDVSSIVPNGETMEVRYYAASEEKELRLWSEFGGPAPSAEECDKQAGEVAGLFENGGAVSVYKVCLADATGLNESAADYYVNLLFVSPSGFSTPIVMVGANYSDDATCLSAAPEAMKPVIADQGWTYGVALCGLSSSMDYYPLDYVMTFVGLKL